MKAEIKSMFSPDVEIGLNEFVPDKAQNFGFLLQMIVGLKGGDGEESFDIMVCTPDWLKENYSKEEIIFGRHYLIVFKYDYQAIYNKLTSFVNNIEADTWSEIGAQIGRIGKWEFEDYNT